MSNETFILSDAARKEIIKLIIENSEIFQNDDLEKNVDAELIRIKQALFLELRNKKKL